MRPSSARTSDLMRRKEREEKGEREEGGEKERRIGEARGRKPGT